jgi:hypothetical protein
MVGYHGEFKMGEKKSLFWGTVFAFASSPVAITAGVAKGTYDAVTGNGSFEEGCRQAATTVVEKAQEFGAEHGGKITGGLIVGASGALGRRVIDGGLGSHKK